MNEHPQDISDRIKTAIPKDLKATKTIESRTIELFKDERMFHFAFILENHREILSSTSNLNKLDAARVYVRSLIDFLVEKGCPPTILIPFKKLLQESKAKSFNFNLLSDLIIISAILSFISAALIRQGAELVGLFPDRDRMTEWCDALYSDLIQMYVGGALELIDQQKYTYEITRSDNGSWFDSFVRLPDFLAGVVAGWNVNSNTISSEKREKIFMETIVDAKNISILRLTFDKVLYLEKIAALRR